MEEARTAKQIDWRAGVMGNLSICASSCNSCRGATLRELTPANDKLFVITDTCTPLPTAKREHYHSIVMSLHYLAKRTRSDILSAVSWCASRVLFSSDTFLILDRWCSWTLSLVCNVRTVG